MPPAIAAIIPVYNRAEWIEEAIESVLAQTFSDFELWVVDDASTDSTPDILSKYQDRIRILRLNENCGVSFARNAAIRASESEWIAFLDSDDLWEPKKLERQIELAERIPEAVLIHTEEIWIRRGKRVNPMKKHAKAGGDFFRRSLRLCLISPSTAMVRRSVLDRIGLFNESLPAAEDYDLWLRILCREQAHFIAEPLAIKRGGHEDQLSRSVEFLDRFRIRVLLDLLRHSPLSAEQREWVFEELEYKCRVFGQGCIKHGRQELGERYLALPEKGEKGVSPRI